MRTISVFGLGYVGAVTAACLASRGYQVIGVDVNRLKVEMLECGRAPVLEPELERLVADGRQSGRLRATTDTAAAIAQSDVSFICVAHRAYTMGNLI